MLRSKVIRALQDYLQAHYVGPIQILCQEGDDDVFPPYAIVRIGSGEDYGMGQADIWDFNVIVAVMNDADATTIEAAEEDAAGLFSTLDDPDAVIAYLHSRGVVASAWVPLTSEAGRDETRWQHFQGFRLIAAPAA
jgi:hypothetical protein